MWQNTGMKTVLGDFGISIVHFNRNNENVGVVFFYM